MRNKLEPTTEYKASKADLSASARIALRFLERDIRTDPGHRETSFRDDVARDGSCVVDTGVRGLLVAFHRVAGTDRISLDDVIDLRHPPSWFAD